MESKNKIVELINNGTISLRDLVDASDLIEKTKFVNEAVEACKKTLFFPVGEDVIQCFDHVKGNYHFTGWCTREGEFSLNSNLSEMKFVGCCNILDFYDVFRNLDTEMKTGLEIFLKEQIQKAKSQKANR